VRTFLGENWPPIAEFIEVESGKRDDRPQLAKALTTCRLHHATLIVAKLDRLARNTRFLLSIIEGTGDEGVVFCDLPTVPAGPVGKFILTQMAAVAELEASLISSRTKAALAAAKARGVRLGGWRRGRGDITRHARQGSEISAQVRRKAIEERCRDLLPVLREIRASGGVSLREIAKALNDRNIRTSRGKSWHPAQVARIVKAIENKFSS
jgi:DNA invertase Pin-like site-specific DNA recombinase